MFFFKSERKTVWNILFQMKNRFFQLESQTPELKGNRQKRSQTKNVLLFFKSLIIKKTHDATDEFCVHMPLSAF